MISLFCFILCSYGMTKILIHGSIFDSIRPSYKFFRCALCVGFWVGVFLCLLSAASPNPLLFSYGFSVENAFLMGCLSAGTSYVLNALFDDFGLNFRFGGDGE